MHPRTEKNVARYKALRAWLLFELGGRCAKVEEPGHVCKGPLHIDHVDGRNWEERELSSHLRIKRIIREYREGVRLRLLCAKANGWDGQTRGHNGKPRRRDG